MNVGHGEGYVVRLEGESGKVVAVFRFIRNRGIIEASVEPHKPPGQRCIQSETRYWSPETRTKVGRVEESDCESADTSIPETSISTASGTGTSFPCRAAWRRSSS